MIQQKLSDDRSKHQVRFLVDIRDVCGKKVFQRDLKEVEKSAQRFENLKLFSVEK